MLDSVEDSLAKFLEEKGGDPSVDMIVARISKKDTCRTKKELN